MAWIIDKDPAVFLKHSPSLGLNNLTANASNFGYIHKGSVVICGLDGSHPQTLKNDEGARAFQVLQCSNEEFDFLVVALDSGVQIWSTDGQRMIYFFDVKGGRSSSSAEDIGQLAQIGTQGIAMVPKGRLFIVGCSDGDVFAFEAKCGPKGEACELQATLKGHQHPVTCAAADTDWLASGDASGMIIAWSAKGNLDRECSFDGDGNPATSLCARGDQAIASFSTGHVRIFDIANKALAVEIAAHSRAINAIDLHPTSMLLVTVGEDLYLNVWELPEKGGQEGEEGPSSGQVGLLASSRVSNCLMTGVRFLSDGSHRIAGTAYDCDTVHMWHRI